MSSDYTTVDITPQQSTEYLDALHVVLGETQKVPPLDARADLKRSIADWAARHEFNLGVFDVLVDTDDDEDVRIILPNLTIDGHGDIVTKQCEYVVTGRFHVEVEVTVTASSEDEARELAEDEFGNVTFDVGFGEGDVTDTQFEEVLDVIDQ